MPTEIDARFYRVCGKIRGRQQQDRVATTHTAEGLKYSTAQSLFIILTHEVLLCLVEGLRFSFTLSDIARQTDSDTVYENQGSSNSYQTRCKLASLQTQYLHDFN